MTKKIYDLDLLGPLLVYILFNQIIWDTSGVEVRGTKTVERGGGPRRQKKGWGKLV
jgi:hypothetical protein